MAGTIVNNNKERSMGRRHTVTVDVEVDLDDFDTEDLEEEIKSRSKGPFNPFEDYDAHLGLQEVYYALKFGQDERALQLMRSLTCNVLGRIL